ncbi:type IV pilus modification protein PilV [Pseudomonas sp. DY-1]|uniref:type IV pilus modification protein PilV n=1 Tax=Pseudomonas sp. DY-1 TaxID=1755504 RepID=UPI00157565EB|nr:type IV pilus modification protein PilV [Pseudomonas sp. DY-1]
MNPSLWLTPQRGLTLIEVLVTILILSIGLLGMAGLQARLQQSEMEAYQRAQALLLLDDMANRIAANRNAAVSYVTGTTSPLGAGMTCASVTSSSSPRDRDISEWCNTLQGVTETSGTARVGAMVGARGCVESIGSNQYLVTVAWQGLTPISAPPSGVACGANSYNGVTGSACANDLCRRVVTTIVRVANL